MRKKHHKRYDECKKDKVSKPNVMLDWGMLARYGYVEQFDQFLQDPTWRNLLSIKEAIYSNITYVFVSTFKIEFPKGSSLNNTIQFYFKGRTILWRCNKSSKLSVYMTMILLIPKLYQLSHSYSLKVWNLGTIGLK